MNRTPSSFIVLGRLPQPHAAIIAGLATRVCLALLGVALVGTALPARADTLADALDAPGWTWSTGGAANWFFQTATTQDGIDAAQCGGLTNAWSESWLQTTVTGRVAVLFWWRSASPGGQYFGFWFHTNDTYLEGLYGNVEWRQTIVSFAGGTNTLKWTSLLGGMSSTAPIATNWLDQVVVTNLAGLRPTLLSQPETFVTMPENYPNRTNLQVRAIGDIPLTYQWQRNGTNLDGETSSSFNLYANSPAQAGDYRVVLSNAWGVTTSEVCAVSVVPSKPGFYPFQPADVVLAPGAYHSFNYVSVFGTAPFSLQWFKDGSPIPNNSIDYATFSDAGGYLLVATNAYGAATSRVAQVIVSTALPEIVSGPDPAFIETTTGASGDAFYVQARGPEPLSYSWRKVGESTELSAWDYLSFEEVDGFDSGFYRAVVANNNGAVTSRVSVLAVAPVTALGLAVNAPHLPVTNHVLWPGWNPDGSGLNAHDGLCAARSPEIGDYNSASFSTVVTGPTNVTFWWRISAAEQAFLEVAVDDAAVRCISGETEWQQANLDLPAGEHTLTWRFWKNEAGSAGEDAAWVDQLTLGPGDAGSGEITVFTTGGDAAWFLQAATTHDGLNAWQSGGLGDGESCHLNTVVTGPGTLTFWWQAESEEYADYLEFWLDGLPQDGISGVASWRQATYTLGPGTHQLEWRYTKDGSQGEGADAGWVDEVYFTPDSPDTYELTNFTSTGAAAWFNQTANSHDGVEAWQSGPLDDDEASSLETTVIGPGTLTFWWMVESEECCDPLEFSVGGATLASMAGQVPWQQEIFELAPGNHTLRWRYTKDGSVAVGRDAGWVDAVLFTPGVIPPTITLEQALNVTNLIFTTGGDAPWWVQTTNSHDGVMAAQSGPIGDNQESWLRTTVTGPGVLTYWYAISTETESDYLSLPWLGITSGGAPYLWTQETLVLPAGTHTLEWRYEKDGSGKDGSDAAWLDEFVWTRLETPLVIVGSQWKYPGETCAFTGAVTGLGPFTLQWYRAGAPIPGATSETLTPFTATYANAGTYSLVAVNSTGATTNDAQLTVAPIFYQVTDLGSLWPGDFTMHPNGVNTRGDVVGNCSTNANALGHAWVWSGGVLTDLGDALGGGDAQAYAINDEGDIVGTARVPGTTNYNAIHWRKVGAGYVVDDLGRNGWPYAFATAINNAGDIAFSMTDAGKSGNGNRRAYLWRNGALLPLGSLTPAWPADIGDAYAWGMNSAGYLVGTANSAPPAPGDNPFKRGWRFNGAWRENVHETYRLATLPDVPWAIDASGVYGVNDYGDLGGQYIHANWGHG
jgi:probable HAF family extracellular repeat protein